MSSKLVGQRIRELREVQCYTREALAEKIDISEKFLYEIEAGKKGFSAEILCRLSAALLVSCDYIMMGERGEDQGVERVLYILKTAEPARRQRLQDMLGILCDICG